jgi:hypothetical protein
MAELLKLPSDVLIILAMTLFLAIVRVTDPGGGGGRATRRLRHLIHEVLSHRHGSSSGKADEREGEDK